MIYVYLVVTAFIGGFIQASTGFGYAIFTMALWPVMVSVADATMMEMLAVLASVLYLVVRLRKHINFKIMCLPVVVANVFSLSGFAMQHVIPDAIIRKILGELLVLLLVYFFFYSGKIKIRPTWKSATVASIVSGAMGGLCNISGPPMVLYYSSACENLV